MNNQFMSAFNEIENVVKNIKVLENSLNKEFDNLLSIKEQLQKPVIINPNIKFKGNLTKRTSTKYIFLHHRAGTGTVESLHEYHLSQGWAGIGYTLYVDLKGNIYQGRPHDTIGAHCLGWNRYSMGICFEGDYTKIQNMPEIQFNAGIQAVNYLREIKSEYNNLPILGHKDKCNTQCPGINFPLDEFKKSLNRG